MDRSLTVAEQADRYGRELEFPTGQQWINRFLDASPRNRLLMAEGALGDAEAIRRCILRNHEMTIRTQRDIIAKQEEVIQAQANLLLNVGLEFARHIEFAERRLVSPVMPGGHRNPYRT
ncbi:MAG TPA: hypothetical protein VJQ25_06505 [Nitrospira sp.]|nr:hypothetical protein [Nitrospira sp.]